MPLAPIPISNKGLLSSAALRRPTYELKSDAYLHIYVITHHLHISRNYITVLRDEIGPTLTKRRRSTRQELGASRAHDHFSVSKHPSTLMPVQFFS